MCLAAHLPAPENQGFAVGTMRWACGVPFHMTYGPHTNTMRDTIRVRLARGEYDRETSGFAFALRLTNDPLADARQCGFEKVSVMEGGIGYLKLNRGHALVLQNRGPMCGRLSRLRPLSTGRDGQVCGACTTSEAPMTISTNRQRRVLPLEDARVAYLERGVPTPSRSTCVTRKHMRPERTDAGGQPAGLLCFVAWTSRHATRNAYHPAADGNNAVYIPDM